MNSEWILVIVTAGLLVATAFYVVYTRSIAKDTKRMADVTDQEHERKVRPQIRIEVARRQFHIDRFGLVFRILNLGFSPITTNKLELKWWLSDQPNNVDSMNISFQAVLQPQKEPVEKEVQLNTAVVLRKRNEFKNQENWQAILQNLIWFQTVVTHSGKDPSTLDTTEGQPFKYN